MNFLRFQIRFFGIFSIFFSFLLFFIYIISNIYKEKCSNIFFFTSILCFFFGFIIWFFNRNIIFKFQKNNILFIIFFFWIFVGFLGSIPFLFLKDFLKISFTDAFFESISGFTATGATIFLNVENFPKSILLYRQLLEWIGGIGITTIFSLFIPIYNKNIIYLYNNIFLFSIKQKKSILYLFSCIKNSIYIYICLTIMCTLLLFFFGISFFDAFNYSCSIVSLGGFSTYNLSLKYFNYSYIFLIFSFFILLSSTNYNLHILFIKRYNWKVYWNNLEFKMFIYLQIGFFLLTLLILYLNIYNLYDLFLYKEKILLQTISISTNTGIVVMDLHTWPCLLKIILFFFSFFSNCSCSLSGGLTITQFIFFCKYIIFKISIFLNYKFLYKINFLDSINMYKNFIFIFYYFLIFLLSILILVFLGLDFISSFSAIMATLNNLGIGFNLFSGNFFYFTIYSKWILIFLMILGRLNFFYFFVKYYIF